MSDLKISELKESLDRLDQTLQLLVKISQTSLPMLRKEIEAITASVKGGYNLELLKSQVKEAGDVALEASKIKELEADINSATKKLIDTVKEAGGRINYYHERANIHLNYFAMFMSGIVGMIVGLLLVWLVRR